MIRKPKRRLERTNHERWLVSYADFITLLFAFFVVMFASSQVDKKKVARIAASFSAYVRDGRAAQKGVDSGAGPRDGASPANDRKPAPQEVSTLDAVSRQELSPVLASLEKDLADEIGAGNVAIALQARGLVLSLRESLLFPPGHDTLNPEAVPILEKVALALLKLPGQPVRLEGHTDNTPIETPQFPSNWELAVARSNAVLQLLSGRFHIEPERLALAGYADYHPVATNDTREGRAHNRRVDLVILSRSAAAMEPREGAHRQIPAIN